MNFSNPFLSLTFSILISDILTLFVFCLRAKITIKVVITKSLARFFMFSSLFLRFLANKQLVLVVCVGSGKDVSVASVLQFQSFSQFRHRQWEVAHGNVGTLHVGEGCLNVTLVHRCCSHDAEGTAGEVVHLFV